MPNNNKIFGFNFVELPRTGIKPFQLLQQYKNNKVSTINLLSELFPHNTLSLPAIKKQKTPNNISDKFKLNLNLEAKVKLFNGLYRKFAKADASAKFSKEDEFVIVAEDAIIKEITSLNQLNNYINDAKLTPDLTNYEKPLKKGNIFIITSIIMCKKFAILLANKNSLNMNTGTEIKDIASLQSSVDISKIREKLIVHSGEEDLVIGFKAHKLRYDKKFWQSKDQAKYSLIPTDYIGVLRDEDLPVEALSTESGTVEFVIE